MKTIANTYILLERYQGITAFLNTGSFFESIKFGSLRSNWSNGILD